jgi:tetratricopeptide (TPR) repeat protein
MTDKEQKEVTLFERELGIYRESIEEDMALGNKYFGFTLLYSLQPDEYLKTRHRLGFKEQSSHDHYNSGVVAAQDEDYAKALKHFDKALKEKPEWMEAVYNRAVVLEKLDRTKDAIRAWDACMALIDEESEERAEIQEHINELKGA